MKIRKAIIPAAGMGTRFLPATKVVPKELLPVVDKPGIQYIVEEALACGIEEIVLVLSRDKMQVLNHFRAVPELEKKLKASGKNDLLESICTFNDIKITVVYQDQPLGLGHAVLCAREAIGDEWCFVFLPDDLVLHDVPCAVQMTRLWETHKAGMVAVMEVPWEQVQQYGVVKALPMTASLGKIQSVIEKPRREDAPSNLAIIGRYLLPPAIFSCLEKVKPGAIGEIQLTDALLALAKEQDVYAFQFEGERFDIGNKLGFVEANLNYALSRPELKDAVMAMVKLVADSR